MATSYRTRTSRRLRRRGPVLPLLLGLVLGVPSALAAGNPPVNTVRPTISGNARFGQTLTATTGTWTGADPITYAFQWRRCDTAGDNCADITSATGLTYTLGLSDIGARLFIRVTATNADGSAVIRSWLSATVVSAPINTVRPQLSGTAKSGETLGVSTGAWAGTEPITLTYQWRRCDADGNNCSDIGGATSTTYVLATADVGGRVQTRVTGTNAYGSGVIRTWNSAVVAGPPAGGASRVGVHASAATLGYEPDADFDRDMDILTSSGAGWVRFDINWAVVQRHGRTSYDWVPFDRIVNEAQARGLKVLGILAYTPGWARPSPEDPAQTPPEDVADYANFVSLAVQRYAAKGVHAYEIWNEPNITSFWKPAPDPKAYVDLLKAGYTAVHAADPSATVVSGGLSPATNEDGNIDPRTFLQAMYANGAKGYFDALGHHPYCFPVTPGDQENWSAWYQMYGTSTSLRGTMIANGDGGKKIWATEYGVPTDGPTGTHVTEAEQSQHVAEAYELFGSYDWAGPLFTYASRDKGTDTSSRYNFYGLTRYDFSAKPALAALQAAAGVG